MLYFANWLWPSLTYTPSRHYCEIYRFWRDGVDSVTATWRARIAIHYTKQKYKSWYAWGRQFPTHAKTWTTGVNYLRWDLYSTTSSYSSFLLAILTITNLLIIGCVNNIISHRGSKKSRWGQCPRSIEAQPICSVASLQIPFVNRMGKRTGHIALRPR